MPARSTFRFLGFPVQVRPGFWFFMALVVFIQGPTFGIPFAIFLAVFTLIHELGHAFAARNTGAKAEIALDFMAGYAAYTPSRPLTKGERAIISFAGPGVQIAIGGIVYLALRGELAGPEPGNAIQLAVYWAGPLIGILNLLPLLPFDGGHLAQVGVEVFAPKSARTLMQWFTIGATVVALALMAFNPEMRRWMFFAVIPLVAVAAQLSQEKNRGKQDDQQKALSRAEAMAWATGVVDFPRGAVPSPWFRAWQQLQAGDEVSARHVLLLDLADTEPVNWWPPDAAPEDALRRVLALLPTPLPTGRPYSAYVLSGVLLKLGRHEDAAHYAAEAYTQGRQAALAIHVARAAAAMGHRTTSLSWLRAAAESSPQTVAEAVANFGEFQQFRDDPEFVAVSR
ncbi:MAG: metalloprotease [Ilumatobacteraceae bacterium]